MPASNRRVRALLVFLCYLTLAAFSSRAESPKGVTSWWPDPSTGLMWTGQQPKNAMSWQEANKYCASLQLGGYSGWRLPTMDEVKKATVNSQDVNSRTGYYWVFKGGIWTPGAIWTALGNLCTSLQAA